jgi:hypothetical protein
MSGKYYETSDTTTALRSWILWQMLRGMGMAALFVAAIGLVLVAIWAVGEILPPESKTQPSPFTQLEMVIQPVALA